MSFHLNTPSSSPRNTLRRPLRTWRRYALGLLLVMVLLAGMLSLSRRHAQTVDAPAAYRLAATYSADKRERALLIFEDGNLVFEHYHKRHTVDTPHMLASGTKSFSGIMALAAVEDGLLTLDEPVATTMTEWKSDPQKAKITIRQLLSLTSGIDAGKIGQPPSYEEAIALSLKHEPGTTFEYGPAPFQIFGELMRRKLAPWKETPLDYLKRRIFNPIGLRIAGWTHQNGQPNLSAGALLTAREWAKFGQLIAQDGVWQGKQIISKQLLAECFVGTAANPNYGLTFWLNQAFDGRANVSVRSDEWELIARETTRISEEGIGADLPKDLLMAAGAGKQRLYIIPSRNLMIVRLGTQSRFDDREFLARLLLNSSQ
jgi:CubicO group peptidase (beta-lactamase class C family)